MRGKHGPKLKDIPGAVLYGTEERPRMANGEPTAPFCAPRHPATPFSLSRRAEDALLRLEWGKGHRNRADRGWTLSWPVEPSRKTASTKLTDSVLADELLAKWTAAYREVA
jgi:hypothetical protein